VVCRPERREPRSDHCGDELSRGEDGDGQIHGDKGAQRAERAAYNFAIVDADDGSILGGCGLTQINWQHRFANLYYWVHSRKAGRGVASAATLQLARYGFETLGLQRIEIVVAAGNLASLRVAEKVGAEREGLLRNRIHINDEWHDAFMHSLIPSDLDQE